MEHDTLAGTKIHAEPVRVAHANLRPHGESPFTKVCPSCDFGLLLVRRDDHTLELINVDRCLLCGQRFIYTDTSIGGEPVRDVSCYSITHPTRG